MHVGVPAQLEFLELELARPDAHAVQEDALALGVAVGLSFKNEIRKRLRKLSREPERAIRSYSATR